MGSIEKHNDIEKSILLHFPKSRIWNAIANSQEFGLWFGMKLKGPFQAGQFITGQIAPTTVDPEVAKMQEPHAGKTVEFFVERINPEHNFSIKWHPFAIDPKIDYSKEPMTIISFSLRYKDGAVLLTITENGFEQIPEWRRADALKANDGGWAHQTKLLEKYLKQS